jgi:hypothetical protein
MLIKRIRFIFLSTFLLNPFLLVALSGCASGPPIPKQRAQAIDLDRKGAEFFQQGQYAKALGFFQRDQ